jgi:hypothetical protein
MTLLILVTYLALIFQWEEFVSIEGRFRIYVPGPMTEKIDKVKTPLGDLDYHTFYFQNKDKTATTLFFMISYCDYPEGTFHRDSIQLIDEFFDETIDAATESLQGKLMYSEKIQLGNNPGRVWRIDYNSGNAVAKTKAFLSGRRYYAVQTIGLRTDHVSNEKFFDSFKLISGG